MTNEDLIHFSTQSRTAISMLFEVNTLFIDVKFDIDIPLISFSHLASEENKLPKEMNDCTCSRKFMDVDVACRSSYRFGKHH